MTKAEFVYAYILARANSRDWRETTGYVEQAIKTAEAIYDMVEAKP